MAGRNFSSQFSFSFEKQVVKLMGTFTQVGSAGARASMTAGDITFTAKAWGTPGNAISVELLDPKTASQSLAITATDDKISVSLATDDAGAIVTDCPTLAAAIQANGPASALVTAVSSSSTKVTPIAETHLTGGAETVFSNNLPINAMSLTQIDDGAFTLELEDKFYALISGSVALMAASATDLQPQLASEDVSTTKIITIRTIAVGSGSPVPTNMRAGNKLLIDLSLRSAI